MRRYVKWVIAMTLIAALSVGTVYAGTLRPTPIHLTISADAVDYIVPSRPSGGGGGGSSTVEPEKPAEDPAEEPVEDPKEDPAEEPADFSGFSKTERENYEKLSYEAMGVVRAAKSAKRTISSANSSLRGKRAVVVSWSDSYAEFEKLEEVGEVEWTGTCIYRSKTGKFSSNPKPYFEVKGKSWYKNNKSLKLSSTYYYKVRSYVIIEGYRFWSDYSDVTGTMVQDAARYTKAESSAYKKLSASEKKQAGKVKTATIKLYKRSVSSGASIRWNVFEASRAKKSGIKWTGAELYYSKSKSMRNAQRIASTKGSSFSVKKSTGLLKKTGYYRVRLYKEIDGVKYYSRYSDILKVKV